MRWLRVAGMGLGGNGGDAQCELASPILLTLIINLGHLANDLRQIYTEMH
ncbi:hypothetical protein TA5114_00672 [Cognatishimia activa]|uniref:Uncharacterized protein n=1 Tax=Cognatishimia activa TaxID=1715691 RepID=A0A0P1IMK1_9RHOB|nr:hypothetical protein TA5113_00119 [Cognatishimia activa]CUK24885.1 hypothetical protein TA5114_00672 [Cognatishimia activa]